ncbi:hypothetical protein BTVI_84829 [Pitangus sulphuratus]|nr:hypothetical protein BTVI_84829 [Pitangus sulphuratus]
MLCLMPPRTRLALLAARALLTQSQLTIEDPQTPFHGTAFQCLIPLSVLRELAQKDALLDLLLVNRVDLMNEVEIGGCLGHSEHEAIKFKLSVDRRKSASKTSALDMRRAEFRLLRELDEDGHLTNRDRDKAEMFNAFFASTFNTDDRSRGSQYPELEGLDCERDQLPVNPEILWDLLLQLNL